MSRVEKRCPAQRSESDPLRALTGKVAGVNVQGSGGVAGGATNITIRGNSSLGNNNQPLFVVDGVPFDNSSFGSTDGAVGSVYPSVTQYPLPGRVGNTDKLYATVTKFPKIFTTTAAQLATFTGTDLTKVVQNDYFLFKFILSLKDGRRIEGFQENVCDEARGEVGDCRVGVRFRKK